MRPSPNNSTPLLSRTVGRMKESNQAAGLSRRQWAVALAGALAPLSGRAQDPASPTPSLLDAQRESLRGTRTPSAAPRSLGRLSPPSASSPDMPSLPADVFFDTASGLNARLGQARILRPRARPQVSATAWRSSDRATTPWRCCCAAPRSAKPRWSTPNSSASASAAPAGRSLRRQGSAQRRRLPYHLGRPPFRDQVFEEDAALIHKLAGLRRAALRQAQHGRARRRRRLPLRLGFVHRPRPATPGIPRAGPAGPAPVPPPPWLPVWSLCPGLGNLGFHRRAVRLLRRHRPAPDLWPRQPHRRHGARLDHR